MGIPNEGNEATSFSLPELGVEGVIGRPIEALLGCSNEDLTLPVESVILKPVRNRLRVLQHVRVRVTQMGKTSKKADLYKLPEVPNA